MRLSRTAIDEIKRRNDLAEVVTEHGIALKGRGKTLFGICPFHEEKTASFGVSKEAGLFHCFGCGAGGDVIGFVVRFHRISFKEALGRLAARSGVQLSAPMQGQEGRASDAALSASRQATVRFTWQAINDGRES